MLHKADCLRLPSLKLLILFSEQTKPITSAYLKEIAPEGTSTASSAIGSLTTQGLVEKNANAHPPEFQITPKGRQHLKEDLEMFPLEGREHTVFKGKKTVVNPRSMKPAAQYTAPVPPPNLSITAESLMGNIAAVLEENARLRDLMLKTYHLLGEALNVERETAQN